MVEGIGMHLGVLLVAAVIEKRLHGAGMRDIEVKTLCPDLPCRVIPAPGTVGMLHIRGRVHPAVEWHLRAGHT